MKHICCKTCLIALFLSVVGGQVIAQASPDTTRTKKRVTLLLPDGRVLPHDKWDSLEQAWGKGRIAFIHNAEDDAKGVLHLTRQTDEAIRQMEEEGALQKRRFDSLMNKQAPEFSLADMHGKKWTLKELRNRVVVLNFWFTSCTPCIKEMPDLNLLVKQYQPKDVVFLALTFNKADEVNKFLQQRTFNYVQLPDSRVVNTKYLVNSYPTSMVIDKKGVIRTIIQSSPEVRKILGASIEALL